MDEDRLKGAVNKAKGSAKEGMGNLTGDEKTKAEGAGDKTKGEAQSTIGGVKDTVRDKLGR